MRRGLALLLLTGCGFTARVGFGPTVTTGGVVGAEGHLAFGLGPGFERGGVMVTGVGRGGFVGKGEEATAGGGLELSGGIVTDDDLAGRLGVVFSARHAFPGGDDSGAAFGVGANLALHGVLSGNEEGIDAPTPFGSFEAARHGGWWLLGVEAQFDYVWGPSDYGVASFPVVLEFWQFVTGPSWL